jgi:hypothetical protein
MHLEWALTMALTMAFTIRTMVLLQIPMVLTGLIIITIIAIQATEEGLLIITRSEGVT